MSGFLEVDDHRIGELRKRVRRALPYPKEPPYVPTVLPTVAPMYYRLDGQFPSR